ncbi:Hypothetical Protein FCC1311_073962 [Hondaea fermentalgiana]|uniref:Uncharacterized protein n=1 Tax=Hondaea fermentalgiana TaxID=2315210 RepID=A0A2R5GKM2_9STRA|nr:Hypothetical Protein FCC1311_073962 [Hondaea fermentalgiana]|eukprot:GBG31175.1 Hypothetical Protein FCC1311_073962 [Hondaea fermentalgiana]
MGARASRGLVVRWNVMAAAAAALVLAWLWPTSWPPGGAPWTPQRAGTRRRGGTPRQGAAGDAAGLEGVLRAIVASPGAHSLATVVVIAATAYYYRHQAVPALDACGLSFLVDLLGLSPKALPPMEDQEDDISDLPPLIDASDDDDDDDDTSVANDVAKINETPGETSTDLDGSERKDFDGSSNVDGLGGGLDDAASSHSCNRLVFIPCVDQSKGGICQGLDHETDGFNGAEHSVVSPPMVFDNWLGLIPAEPGLRWRKEPACKEGPRRFAIIKSFHTIACRGIFNCELRIRIKLSRISQSSAGAAAFWPSHRWSTLDFP